LPLASVEDAVQAMWSSTPPVFVIVIVPPVTEKRHSSRITFLPPFVMKKQLTFESDAVAAGSQTSTTVAVNVAGCSPVGGVMRAGSGVPLPALRE
jgi:hypothetical protein